MAPVAGGAANVVDRRGAAATSSPKRVSAASGIGAPPCQAGRLVELARRGSPRPRAPGAASGRPSRCRVPTRARGEVERERERADGDHHRVARADLRELLRAARRGDEDGRDQLVGGEHVALRARVRSRRSGSRRMPALERSSTVGVAPRTAAAARRPPARRCRGCRRSCRGCGSAESRPCALRARGRAAAAPSSAMQPRVGRCRHRRGAAVSPGPSRVSSGNRSGRGSPGAEAIEVELDHQVGAAEQGDAGDLAAERERLVEVGGSQHVHVNPRCSGRPCGKGSAVTPVRAAPAATAGRARRRARRRRSRRRGRPRRWSCTT